MDAYFTPKDIALFMAGLHLDALASWPISLQATGAVVRCRAKWPSSNLIGTDINSSSLRLLRANLKGRSGGEM